MVFRSKEGIPATEDSEQKRLASGRKMFPGPDRLSYPVLLCPASLHHSIQNHDEYPTGPRNPLDMASRGTWSGWTSKRVVQLFFTIFAGDSWAVQGVPPEFARRTIFRMYQAVYSRSTAPAGHTGRVVNFDGFSLTSPLSEWPREARVSPLPQNPIAAPRSTTILDHSVSIPHRDRLQGHASLSFMVDKTFGSAPWPLVAKEGM